MRLVAGCTPLLASLVVFGCGGQSNFKPKAAGTLALTQDDAVLYAVDGDNGLVVLVDTASEQPIREVKVGRQPEQILLAPDDTAYVANRGDRSVSVIRRDSDQVDTIAVGVEPVGLALSPDAATLYVVNAASREDVEHGSLMAVDTSRLTVKWEMQLPPEPRAIALTGEHTAAVSLYKTGEVIQVDLAEQKITSEGSGIREKVNSVPDPRFEDQFQSVTPRAVNQVVVSPDGQRVYGTVTWASDAVLNANTPDRAESATNGASTYGSHSGSGCAAGAVASPGVVTFDAQRMSAVVDPLSNCGPGETPDRPALQLVGSRGGDPLQGPSAMVVDHGGQFLYVAMKESNNVAIVPTSGRGVGVRQTVPVGDGTAPTGLALSSDGTRLYVHTAFDRKIRTLVSSGEGAESRVVVEPTAITVAHDPEWLTPDVAEGRKLFFSATNSVMNNPHSVGISCASCHLEGREDGHVWNFREGPRQTPSLAGRQLADTAPFHWGGEHSTFHSFLEQTVKARMGGTGLASGAEEAKLLAFIESMPLPDNPNRRATPTDAQIRGAHAFQKAECNTCHLGANFTDNQFADVGTFVFGGEVPDDIGFLRTLAMQRTGDPMEIGLNTPSLLGVGRTAPYLHDGSAATLRDRLMQSRALDKHGKTSLLSEAELADLVEYLKAL